MQAHRGPMLLAFGILGILICPVFAVLAWVMGRNDLAEIQAGRMDPEGETNTRAGKTLGIIGSLVFLVSILLAIAAFGWFMLMAPNSPVFSSPW